MLVTTLQQWGRVESRQPCIVVSPTLSQPPTPPPTPPSPPPPPALDQIFETHRARIRSRSFCQNKPRSNESISLISYRIFERCRDIAHMSERIQYIFSNIWDIWDGLWYLIKNLRDIAHMSEWVSAIPQGLNRPRSSAEKKQQKKKQNSSQT